MIPFLRVTNVNKLDALTAGPAAPSPAVSRPPLSLFSSQRRLLPLRVTPTHFALTFYDRVLRLPTSVHISGLAILRAKSRLSCFLGELLHPLIRSYFLLLLPGGSFSSFLHSPPRNPSSFSVELILSYRCSCFDPPLSRHLLFFSSQILALSLVCFPVIRSSFYLTLAGISGRNYPSSPFPLPPGYNWSLVTHFSQGIARLINWPNGMYCSSYPLFHVVSLLLRLVSALLFSQVGVVLSHQNISTHRFPQCPLRNPCFLVTLIVSSLVFAATDTASFKLLPL